jgi:beta-glucanase (GH16 family)
MTVNYMPVRLSIALVAALIVASATGPAYGAWQLAWSDEFDGTTVNPANWTYDTGNGFWAGSYWVPGWGNNEKEYYTSRPENVYVAGGLLHIAARQESYSGFDYTSGRIKTMGLFTQQCGRFEFRARLPQGTGTWPALWMLPQNPTYGGWPNNGEIDVMENKGTHPDQVGGTIHFGGANGNDVYFGQTFTFPSGDSVTNFHVYALEWTSNSISWSVDGVVYEVQNNWWSNIGTSTDTYPFPAPFDQPFYILMNLAIGGNYLGNPSTNTINSGTTFPAEMQLDYVRAYVQAAATTPPDAPTDLTARPGNGSVFLNWNAPADGATGYHVKRATASGGSYTTIGSVAGTSFTDPTASSCSTYYYVVSATNSIGESTDSSEAAAELGAYALAVNAGGGTAGSFVGDAYFSGGTQASPVSTTIDTSGATDPAPQSVYQTERFGNFSYTFSGLTPGLSYKVRLHFAETYWTSTGQRRFNVFINGTQVLTNFDIVAVAGAPNKATVQEFMATPNGGQIVIQYATVTDNAKASGIELLLPRTAAPTAGNNGPLYEGMTLNLTASTVPGATYSWSGPDGFTSALQNPSITGATTNASGTYTVTASVGGCTSVGAATAVTVNPVPALSIELVSPNFTLTWSDGVLQSATNVSGPWIDVTGASTPYTNSADQPREFFRVRLPQ